MAYAAAAMGGDINVGVGLDQTFVTMDVLSESAPDALGLIADVLQRPDFPESEFDRIKQGSQVIVEPYPFTFLAQFERRVQFQSGWDFCDRFAPSPNQQMPPRWNESSGGNNP